MSYWRTDDHSHNVRRGHHNDQLAKFSRCYLVSPGCDHGRVRRLGYPAKVTKTPRTTTRSSKLRRTYGCPHGRGTLIHERRTVYAGDFTAGDRCPVLFHVSEIPVDPGR